ncbi:glycosyltransferase [Ferruginibacter paludis]|uniref:glycosyltransferase n=1 Tax=Ferruginibacter paludis TaxID=1310417 RepID=UPI0025B4880C|nr:glycosyltransferase [Ferruginibacter paludis]MDN3656732.1 glycosyltransferase [Ferruginibacter paludis]
MKISVLLITYNQSAYIPQCLASIVTQQVDGEIEVVVADDFSTDNTVMLIRSFAEQSAFNFIFLPTSVNLGLVKNYHRAFAACSGDYIAVMEGDDYWTDSKRLQKHLLFFDAHPECVMAMNRYIMRNEFFSIYCTPGFSSPDTFEYVSGPQMAIENQLGNMSACVFRTSAVQKIKPDLFDLPVADWMIGMVLSEFGVVAILNEYLSVYRIHKNGQWSQLNEQEQIKKMNELIDQYDHYLGYRYHTEFVTHKQRLNGTAKQVVPSRGYRLRDFVPPVMMKVLKIN